MSKFPPLTTLLDDSLYYRAREPQDKKFPLRPSAAGYCSKRLTLDLMEYLGREKFEKDYFEPNVMRLLSFGHHVEAAALSDFEKVPGLKVMYKQQAVTLFKLNDGKLIEGSIDAVFDYQGQKVLVDVKSVKNAYSNHFKTRWDDTIYKYSNHELLEQLAPTEWLVKDTTKFVDSLGDDFFTDNFYQINAYMFSSFAEDHGITRAAIYRYCKNDSNHMVIQFDRSAELFKRVRDKFNRINEKAPTVDVKDLRCDYILGSIRCAFCPYKDKCHDQDAMKAWLKEEYGDKKFAADLSKAPKELKELFKLYVPLSKSAEEKLKLEPQIIKLMIDSNLPKIKLDNNHVYELKSLKDRIELRRGKL